MPTRLLREGILDSDAVNSLTAGAEVFYRRLMSVVDDYGRFDGRLSVLRGRLYALQLHTVREANLERWIAECEKARLVRLYEVAGKPYILLEKLGEPRAKSSKYPPPDEEPRAGVNGCAQTRADVPPSYSPSDSDSTSDSKHPPHPPPGGELAIPDSVNTPEFAAAWLEWCQHRRERKPRVTPSSGRKALAELAELGPRRAVAAIHHSIAKGWQGIFERGGTTPPKPAGSMRDRIYDKLTTEAPTP